MKKAAGRQACRQGGREGGREAGRPAGANPCLLCLPACCGKKERMRVKVGY